MPNTDPIFRPSAVQLIEMIRKLERRIRVLETSEGIFDINNENTPTTLGASQNNYNPGNYDILRLSSSGPFSITGMQGGVKGRRLQVFNVGNYTLSFSHQSAMSSATNRFKFNTSLPAFVEPGQNITFYYDSTQQRWIEATNVFDYDIASAWDTQTAPADGSTDIVWADALGLFVAVGTGPTYVMTSPDGINWTAQTPAANLLWEGIAWSPTLGLLVATARSGVGNRVMTSTNGTLWTSQVSAADNNWYSIAWSPNLGLFAAIAQSAAADQIMTSPDGIVWTPHTASNSFWKDIVWASTLGLFVAVSETGSSTNICTSSDGTTWSTQTKTSTETLRSIAWSPELGILVAVGINAIYSSINGANWTRRSSLTSDNGAVAWSPELGIFLTVSRDALKINQWSADGITWSSSTGIGNSTSIDIAWSNALGLFVAIGYNVVYTTP